MSAEALIWLWNNLKPDPFGIIPLTNLSGKTVSVSSLKNYEHVTSYNWLMEPYTDIENPNPTMIIPGAPKELIFWNGGKLALDEGYMIYDANHLRYPIGAMDPLFQACKVTAQKQNKEINFQEFDFVTDCINLQKIFVFCKGDEEGGLFRIDLERVGNTIIASRVEGSDVVAIDYDTFDQNLKAQCSKPLNAVVEGPFQQIVKYNFGQFKMLVRFEPDFADYTKHGGGTQGENGTAYPAPPIEDRTLLPESQYLRYVDYGKLQKHSLMTSTSFPAGRGFPSYTWAQLFFSGMDSLLIGWWKGTSDFNRPAIYSLPDIGKMVKPLPYSALGKVHDFLQKITTFMRKNHQDLKVSLLWKGSDFIEIYERSPVEGDIITNGMKDYLQTQVTEPDPADVDDAE